MKWAMTTSEEGDWIMPALLPRLLILPLSLAVFTNLAEARSLREMAATRAGNDVPKLDIESACRDASGLDLKRNTIAGCLVDENNARKELQKDWASFPSNMRERCLGLATPPALPSYLALQACLNTARDAKNLDKAGGPNNLPGTPGIR